MRRRLQNCYRAVAPFIAALALLTGASPASAQPPSDWMASLADRLRDLQVNHVVIPGSHDSGTYNISGSSLFAPDDLAQEVAQITGEVPFLPSSRVLAAMELNSIAPQSLKNFVAGWSRTQTKSITQQLNDGIRYFDLRASGNYADGGRAWVAHGFLSVSFASVLAQLRAFTVQHPSEILIVEISKFHGMSLDAHSQLISNIEQELGPYLVPRSMVGDGAVHPNITFGQLWDAGKRIFVLYEPDGEAYVNNNLLDPSPALTTYIGSDHDINLWPDHDAIQTPWPRQTNTDALIKFLSLSVTSPRNIWSPTPDICYDCPFQVHEAILTETPALLGLSAEYNSLGQYVDTAYKFVASVIETVKNCHVDSTFPFVHCEIKQETVNVIPPMAATLHEWERDGALGQDVGPNALGYLQGAWSIGDQVNSAIPALNLVFIDFYDEIHDSATGLSYVQTLINLNTQMAFSHTRVPTPTNTTADIRVGDRLDFAAAPLPLTRPALDQSYRQDLFNAFFGVQLYIVWDFGDGQSTCKPTGLLPSCHPPELTASHVYDAPGCYIVKAFLMAFNGARNMTQEEVCVLPALDRPHVTAPPAIVIAATEPGGGARVGSSPALQAFLGLSTVLDASDPSPVQLPTLAEIADVTYILGPDTVFPPGASQVDFQYRDKWGNSGIAFSTVTVLAPPRVLVAGQLKSDGTNRWIELTLSNNGLGAADHVVLSDLRFRTLSGSGAVTLSNPAAPITVGPIVPGAIQIARVNVNVPATVGRFMLTEAGVVFDVAGNASTISSSQSFSR